MIPDTDEAMIQAKKFKDHDEKMIIYVFLIFELFKVVSKI